MQGRNPDDQKRRTPKTLAEIATKTWNSEIGFSGYDAVKKTINGEKVSYDAEYDANNGIDDADHKKRREYRNSVARQVTDFFFGNFLGMRNDTRAQDVGRTMIKNMVWWPEAGAPVAQRVMQFVGMGLGLATLITPAYIVYSLARNIVLNTAKTILKFIPQLAVNGFSELEKRIKDKLDNEDVSNEVQFGLELAQVALMVAKAPFQVIEFVGGAILSPIDNFRMASKNKNAGFWLAALSVAVTVIAYAILFPIVSAVLAKQVPAFFTDVVSPFFTNTVVSFLTAKAPWLVKAATVVSDFVAPAVNWVGNAISTAYSAVSGWISDALSWVWNSTVGTDPASMINLTANYAMSQASALTSLDLSAKLVGFGAMLSAGATVIGTPFVRLYQFVANKFVNNTPAPAAPVVDPAAAQAAPAAVVAPAAAQAAPAPVVAPVAAQAAPAPAVGQAAILGRIGLHGAPAPALGSSSKGSAESDEKIPLLKRRASTGSL